MKKKHFPPSCVMHLSQWLVCWIFNFLWWWCLPSSSYRACRCWLLLPVQITWGLILTWIMFYFTRGWWIVVLHRGVCDLYVHLSLHFISSTLDHASMSIADGNASSFEPPAAACLECNTYGVIKPQILYAAASFRRPFNTSKQPPALPDSAGRLSHKINSPLPRWESRPGTYFISEWMYTLYYVQYYC